MCSKEQESSQESNLAKEHEAEATQPETEVEATVQEDNKDEQIAQLKAQIDEMVQRERDIVLRAKAEEDNIRRRADLDVEKAHKFALEKFSFELLPVIDNLERALQTVNKEDPTMASMIEGLELTRKSFLDAVHKFGIEVVEDKNVPFNPELHQAMTIIESPDHDPNQVIDMMQKGYTLNGRLLRPAMVVVSK